MSTTTTAPRTEVRTMNKGTEREFERVFAFCPDGHEMVSSPVTSRTGRALMAGDFTDEFCGHGACNYHRHLWDKDWTPRETTDPDTRGA